MKSILAAFIFIVLSGFSNAQLNASDTVFLKFQNIEGEVNVNGDNALNMLKDYLLNRTNLIIVETAVGSTYTIQLSIVEKNMGNRRGQLKIFDNQRNEVIFETKWVKGTSNAFYGYSGSRHAIGVLVRKYLLKEYQEIIKEN